MNNGHAYLIDTSIYVFRAWHTLPDTITDTQGRPVNAVYGFTDFVARLLHEQQPKRIAFAFDVSLTTSFRNEIFPAYKANREPAPAELKHQFAICREFLHALGIATYSNEHYEADDLIGALAQRIRQDGVAVNILTADKDLAQLIEEGDSWWDYARDVRLDCAGIEKKFGVRPDQIADQLAIAGDKIDNIPGVPGIGMATAAKLLRRFETVGSILENTTAIGEMKVRGAKRLQGLIEEHQDSIRLSRRLTGIHCDIGLASNPELKCSPSSSPQLEALFTQLNFGAERKRRWQTILKNYSCR